MEPQTFSRFVEQLCREGKIARQDLGDLEIQFIQLLDELDISYETCAASITLDSHYELINLETLKSAAGLQRFDWNYNLVTQSTNNDVLSHYEFSGRQNIAVCEAQTGGKGRRGNRWISPFAKNIYCTIGMLKTIEPGQLGLLSIATGVALCETLNRAGIGGVKLKWPNDLYHANRKLGGILIESRPVSEDSYFLAIGIGLNVLMSPQMLAAIPQAATSLNLIAPRLPTREALLTEAVNSVVSRIEAFDEQTGAQLVRDFDRHDAFYNQPVCVSTATGQVNGKNAGINLAGQFQLETGAGYALYSAADISLRDAS